MLLVPQLAFHPMFKISTIHQHTCFNSNRRSRRSLGLRAQSAICHSMHALGYPLLSSFVVRLSNPNVFCLLPGNFLITLSSSYPLIRYTILINTLTFSVKIMSEVFNDIVRDDKKSPANNYKHYQKLIQ